MAINPLLQFVGKIIGASGAYPWGQARDITTPGDGTGTPWLAVLLNDIFGFQQALLTQGNISPSNTPDTAITSQYLISMQKIFEGRLSYEDGGSPTAYTLTSTVIGMTEKAYRNGAFYVFEAANTNTGAATLAIDALAAGPIELIDGSALAGGEIQAGEVIIAKRVNSGAKFQLIYSSELLSRIPNESKIQEITGTVAANALTVGLEPTTMSFRSATLGSGTVNLRTVLTALSLVVPSGATLGTVSTIQSELILLAIDNAGTVELAIVNLSGVNDLSETGVISTTTMSAASDSANVFYSTVGRSNVPYRVVGRITSTQAVAGTWATAPSLLQGYGGQALAAMSSIGYGQTWQDVTGSRSSGVTYYNTTGKPIEVGISSTGSLTITIGGLPLLTQNTTQFSITVLIIPPGASYIVTAGPTINKWFELR
jgi:hypothetical protein